MARRSEQTSILSVGPTVAATLLADVPQLGRIDGAAHAWTGQWKGRSSIRDSRAGPLRMLLYTWWHMAVLSAIRHDPDMARSYADTRDRGKPIEITLTAVTRKLAVRANALLKQNRLWSPEPAPA